MQVRQLKLVNFRNYKNLSVTFSPRYNLIYGNNGMGKTNLIEAIFVLALTKSFRGSLDKVLIMNGEKSLTIEGVISSLINSNYQITISNEGKKVKINGNNVKKLSDYISKITVILFSSLDLRMIKDTPSVRRKNLNIDISSMDNSYLKLLSNYNKLLKQRNIYLKSMNINSNTDVDYFEVVTDKLIDIGLKINTYRNDFISQINEYIGNIYKNITEEEGLHIEYHSSYNNLSKEEIKKNYKKVLQRDIILGKTEIGIHHDDLIFKLNKFNLKDYGSEGQQKNAIISYKLSEIEFYKKKNNDEPILILDDLFSELDNQKINNLLNILDKNIQTFITTTNIDIVDEKIKKQSMKIVVDNGTIKEES